LSLPQNIALQNFLFANLEMLMTEYRSGLFDLALRTEDLSGVALRIVSFSFNYFLDKFSDKDRHLSALWIILLFF